MQDASDVRGRLGHVLEQLALLVGHGDLARMFIPSRPSVCAPSKCLFDAIKALIHSAETSDQCGERVRKAALHVFTQ